MYCVKCKKHTETTDVKLFTARNKRLMQRGTCVACGNTKTQFVKTGSGLFNKVVSNLPFELHLPGHNFTGPGTRLDRRLNPDLTPREWSKPINRVDTAAYHHDLCYAQNPDRKTRNEVCDREMLRELNEITNPSLRERLDRGIVKNLINAKVNLGLGIKKAARDPIKWTDKLAEELHKPVIKKFRKRRVYVGGIDKIFAADLVDMQSFSKYNNGVKYLLSVIDIFSKYGWIQPLKNKTGLEVASALSKVFKERKPDKLWVDKGKEFYNAHVQKLVTLYSTENEEKSTISERYNRTMKEKMFKYFTANSTRKYIDILDELVHQYNNTIHSSIGMTPKQASEKKNEVKVWTN